MDTYSRDDKLATGVEQAILGAVPTRSNRSAISGYLLCSSELIINYFREINVCVFNFSTGTFENCELVLFEMLLFRQEIMLAADDNSTDAVMPLIVSTYRNSIDTGYGDLMKRYAAQGVFDEYFLLVLTAILSTGNEDFVEPENLSWVMHAFI